MKKYNIFKTSTLIREGKNETLFSEVLQIRKKICSLINKITII